MDDVKAFGEAWMIDNAEVLYDVMALESEKRHLAYCTALTRFLTAYNAGPLPNT